MNQPQPPAAASFTIDLERAPQAVKDLEHAQEQLVQLRQDANQLGRVVPPAQDQVSRDAAAALSAIAVGQQGSLVQMLDTGIERIGRLAESLREELRSYSSTESSNKQALKS